MTAMTLDELGIAPKATDEEKEQQLLKIAADMYGVSPTEMARRNEERLRSIPNLGETSPIIDKPEHFPLSRAADTSN